MFRRFGEVKLWQLGLLTATALGIACATPVDETKPAEDRLGIQYVDNDPMEGELFGRFYSSGTVLTSGTQFSIGLTPLAPGDLESVRLAGGFSDAQQSGLAVGKAHWGWNDPVANDGACEGIGDWSFGNRESSVLSYEAGARIDGGTGLPQYWAVEAHPRGATTDPATLETHCIRPGTYELTATRSGWGGASRRIDYVGVEVGPSDYVTVSIPGGTAQIEAESYSREDWYRDVEANFDIVEQLSEANVVPALSIDVGSSYSTGSFTPGTGTSNASDGDYIRSLVAMPTPSTARYYLVRTWWEYGSVPNAATGFYSDYVAGYLLRWHRISTVGASRCIVVGADQAHMSLAPRPNPQVYQRVGVGRACYSGQDLVIGAVAAHATSTTVVPQLIVSNVNGGSYSGSATVTLYASTDAAFGSDVLLGSQSVSLSLAAAESKPYTLSSYNLPTTGQTYYLFAVLSGVTGESETSNNTMYDPAGFTAPPPPPAPDLVITSITGPTSVPLYATAATNYTINYANIGTAASGSTTWQLPLKLSTDAAYGGDTWVYQTSVATSLTTSAPGNTGTRSVFFTPPAGITPGTYYLVSKADSSNVITELNENNNTGATSAISITATGDMVIDSIKGPTSMGQGETGTFPVYVRNAGSDPARPAKVKLWLSTDNTLSAGDSLLGTIDDTPLMTSGVKRTESVSVTIPATMPTGNYYVIAKVDADSTVYESAEGNNTFVRPTQLTVTAPTTKDLTVFSLVQSVTTVEIGQSYTWNLGSAKNLGAATVDSGWTGALYLSTDNTWSAGDVLILRKTFGSLAPNATVGIKTTATAPAVTPGNYYLIYRVDDTGVVSETNEGNNVGVTVGTVFVDYL
jgi:hypothetical protein